MNVAFGATRLDGVNRSSSLRAYVSITRSRWHVGHVKVKENS